MAAALMMLALVSALVGFRGWPGGMSDSVASVPVARSADAPQALAQVRRVAVREEAPARALRAERAAPQAPRAVPTTTAGLVKTTTVETAPTGVVKVPPGVEMTLPPSGRPTAPIAPQSDPATQPPAVTPPGDQPPALVPTPGDGGGPAPEDIEQAVDQVVGPLPGGGPSEGGTGDGLLTPQLTLEPGTIGVALGATSVSVSLGP